MTIPNTSARLILAIAAVLWQFLPLSAAPGAAKTIVGAPPSITSISPESPYASNDRQTVIVRGSNFDPRAAVHLKDLRTGESFRNRPVYDRSSTQLELRVVFTDRPAEWSVEVVNPDGQSSGQYRFRVVASSRPGSGSRGAPASAASAPRLQISGIDPAQPIASNDRQTLIISGANFDRRARVTLRDLSTGESFPNRSTSRPSETSLTLRVNFTDKPAEWSVEVINPDGRSSGEYRFRVAAPPPPRITRLEPAQPIGSTRRQSVVIHGANFDRRSRATLRDLTTGEVFQDRRVSRATDTSLTLNANFTEQPAEWSIEVINPNGQSSGQYRFRVVAPAAAPSDAALTNANNAALARRATEWARSQIGRSIQPCDTTGCRYNPDNRDRDASPCTRPTRPDPDQDTGHAAWHRWCARFVANCYDDRHVQAGEDSAQAIYDKLDRANQIQRSQSNIPDGALVFWRWKEGGKEWGHVGISYRGKVIHTGLNRADAVRQDSIAAITDRLGGDSFLGWAAPFGWRGVLARDWPGRSD